MRGAVVEWVDSCSYAAGWDTVQSYRERLEVDVIVSIGFLLVDTDEHIGLALSFTPLRLNAKRTPDNLNVNHVLVIPRAAIRSVRTFDTEGDAS